MERAVNGISARLSHIRRLRNHFRWKNFPPSLPEECCRGVVRARWSGGGVAFYPRTHSNTQNWRDQENVIVQLFFTTELHAWERSKVFFFNSAKNFLPSDKLKPERWRIYRWYHTHMSGDREEINACVCVCMKGWRVSERDAANIISKPNIKMLHIIIIVVCF
jgi:hypothetical protein